MKTHEKVKIVNENVKKKKARKPTKYKLYIFFIKGKLQFLLKI